MQTRLVSECVAIELLDREYSSLMDSLGALTRSVPLDLLYKPTTSLSIGENILKSAGVVEQTFGGITTNLWDDPFEWTLPETLSTPERILDYLSEVETLKKRAFSSFVDDQALLKYIAVPSAKPIRLLQLLIETLMRSSAYRGQALATLKMLSAVSAPGFII